jgi:hypothetical protein
MTNEEISAKVVKIFEPHYHEEAVKVSQEFIQKHAQLFGLSPNDSLEPIADHLLLAAEKLVEPSSLHPSVSNSRLYGNNGLF